MLMLFAILPLAGWAQGILAPDSYFKNGNFVYQVITSPVPNGEAGTAKLVGVRDGYNPVDADGKLTLDGNFSIVVLEDDYSLVVTEATADALRNNYDIVGGVLTPKGEFAGKTTATSVVIPKEYTKILANTFVGYTNLKTISFEANSVVTNIAGGAFTTTQISTFDFSNCSKLEALAEGIFVEPGFTNSYITTIKLPTNAEALNSIGTAFQNLTNLTAIENLDQSLITTLAAKSFEGDAKLATLALPATIETIAADAFEGSGVKNLTIDVTSMEDVTPGNIYGASFATLETLTLKGVLSGTFKPSAFAGCTNLESVTMNDATKPFVITGGTIGANAFAGCTKLESLTFNPITEGTIGLGAFNGCTKLASVEFGTITGTDLTDALISAHAFDGCTKLATITFGNLQYVAIGEEAFADCGTEATATALSFGTLDHVTIGVSAFEGCTKMNAISFGATNDLVIANNAFRNCTSALAATVDATLTFSTLNNVTIGGTLAVGDDPAAGAFWNCTKLNSIAFGVSDGLEIQDWAFHGVASAGKPATVQFANATNLKIGQQAFEGMTKAETITFGTITDNAPFDTEIGEDAFAGATGLKTLAFDNLTGVEIAEGAFENASRALDGTNYATATFGDLSATTITEGAFDGANRLAIVTIGDVIEGSEIGQGTASVFPNLKKVTIGTVKGEESTIGAGAFVFDNFSAATVDLATATNKYLQYTGADDTKTMIDEAAFDFTATVGGFAGYVAPVVNIGEIKSANTLAAGALKGDEISTINFKGAIVANGLNKMIIVKSTTALKLATLVFDGAIAQHGIKANAFAALPEVMTITFNGKMAAGAVDDGAFEGLVEHSHVTYAYDESDIDLTVNPFAKKAFKATAVQGDARIIEFSVVNAGLAAKFDMEDLTNGLLSDGTYAIYLAGYVAPVPVVVDLSFLVYPDLNAAPRTAWARWELGARVAEGVTGTLTGAEDLVIKRVQKIDGTNNAKITIYGTYTDEDDALNLASVYMVPLKAKNGFYHIPHTNKTTLIVKVENNGADFTETSYKVECNHAGAGTAADPAWPDYDEAVCTTVVGAKNGSIWPGLLNKELFVASNIMTNQQLVDKTATDPANAGGGEDYGYYHNNRAAADIDIYRTGATIAEDLYIMSDPSKNKGFRIAKSEITSSNNAYINTGWYYMLLKKYEGAAAAAHVVWMDDATEGEITGILTVKDNAKNVAAKSEGIYTLQGVRVSEMQKGQIYIVNGKKYIAK